MTLENFINTIALGFIPGETDPEPLCTLSVFDAAGDDIATDLFVDSNNKPDKDCSWYADNKKKTVKRIYFDVTTQGRGHVSVYLKSGNPKQ